MNTSLSVDLNLTSLHYAPQLFINMWHFADIHEFYTYTLEDRTKTVDVKTSEANQLAERWEGHGAPVPAEVQDQARQSLVCGINYSVNSPCFSPRPYILCGCFPCWPLVKQLCNVIHKYYIVYNVGCCRYHNYQCILVLIVLYMYIDVSDVWLLLHRWL